MAQPLREGFPRRDLFRVTGGLALVALLGEACGPQGEVKTSDLDLNPSAKSRRGWDARYMKNGEAQFEVAPTNLLLVANEQEVMLEGNVHTGIHLKFQNSGDKKNPNFRPALIVDSSVQAGPSHPNGYSKYDVRFLQTSPDSTIDTSVVKLTKKDGNSVESKYLRISPNPSSNDFKVDVLRRTNSS